MRNKQYCRVCGCEVKGFFLIQLCFTCFENKWGLYHHYREWEKENCNKYLHWLSYQIRKILIHTDIRDQKKLPDPPGFIKESEVNRFRITNWIRIDKIPNAECVK